MSDFLMWSINLGRWSGTTIRIHILLILFAVSELLWAAWAPLRTTSSPTTVAAPPQASAKLAIEPPQPSHELSKAPVVRPGGERPTEKTPIPELRPPNVPETAGWLLVLLVALALHEAGHVVVAARFGADVEDIRL